MIKAIETRYAGHKFRSRLEARWAVLFDQLEIEWLYESEGYDVDGKWYLPDFDLPGFNAFFEVKGPQKYDHDMLYSMSCQLGRPIFMVFNSIPDPEKDFGYIKRVNKVGFVDYQLYECAGCHGVHLHESNCHERGGYMLSEAFEIAREEDFKSIRSPKEIAKTEETIHKIPSNMRTGLLALNKHQQNRKQLDTAVSRKLKRERDNFRIEIERRSRLAEEEKIARQKRREKRLSEIIDDGSLSSLRKMLDISDEK